MTNPSTSTTERKLIKWRPVVGYEGRYEVSSNGWVKRVPHCVKRSDGVVLSYGGKNLKRIKNGTGRCDVKISRKTLRIAHLVASAFIGPRPPGTFVGHKDGDKENDNVGNLEYITRSRNVLNMADKLRCDNTSGVKGVSLTMSPYGKERWCARFSVDGVTYAIESRCREKAVAWRKAMEKIHNADRRDA